jgi:hypothetical protein
LLYMWNWKENIRHEVFFFLVKNLSFN